MRDLSLGVNVNTTVYSEYLCVGTMHQHDFLLKTTLYLLILINYVSVGAAVFCLGENYVRREELPLRGREER